jgi:serine/threonine-protein kinase
MGNDLCRARSSGFAVGTAFALLVTAIGPDARAQSAQDAAAAEVLFNQAKDLMRQKKYGEACPKFAESNRLDTGIGTMLWLADCYEKNGQTASAWAQFVEAADAAASKHDEERERVARGRAATLEPSLAKLTLVVPPASEIPGLQIKRDGELVGKALWGAAIPVDPGSHTIAATAPGKKDWQTTLDIGPGNRSAVANIPALGGGADADTSAVRAEEGGNAAPVPQDASSGNGSLLRTSALVTAGAGIVGMGLGALFGLQAKSHLDESNSNQHCLPDNRCDGVGTLARNQAISSATASTVSFVVGGVLVAGGVVLYLLAPSSHDAAAQAGRSPLVTELTVSPLLGGAEGGASLRGRF